MERSIFLKGTDIQQGTMSCFFLFDSYRRLDWETRLALLERGQNLVKWFFFSPRAIRPQD